jgi:predicted phage-related endonuclease
MPTVKSKTTTSTTTTLDRESVSLDHTTAAAIEEWVEVKDMIKALEARKKALDSHIKEVLGDAEVGTIDGKVRIEVSHRQRNTVDTEALAEAFPEAYEATKRTTSYTVLITK